MGFLPLDTVTIKPGSVGGSKFWDGRSGKISQLSSDGETAIVSHVLKSGRTVKWIGSTNNLKLEGGK